MGIVCLCGYGGTSVWVARWGGSKGDPGQNLPFSSQAKITIRTESAGRSAVSWGEPRGCLFGDDSHHSAIPRSWWPCLGLASATPAMKPGEKEPLRYFPAVNAQYLCAIASVLLAILGFWSRGLFQFTSGKATRLLCM